MQDHTAQFYSCRPNAILKKNIRKGGGSQVKSNQSDQGKSVLIGEDVRYNQTNGGPKIIFGFAEFRHKMVPERLSRFLSVSILFVKS